MSDATIKQKLRRARTGAADALRRSGYGIIEVDEKGPFSIIAVRYSEARFVRVIVGQVSIEDMKACRSITVPAGCVREVWTREGRAFDIKAVL